jgi:hypothetical protein
VTKNTEPNIPKSASDNNMESKIFQPTHIPYFFQLENEPFKFGSATIKVYGFVVLYLVYIKSPNFYFSKKQIATICNLHVDTVKDSLSLLEGRELIYRYYSPHPITGVSVKFTGINLKKYHLLLEGGGGSNTPGGEGSNTPPNIIIKNNIKTKNNNLIKYINNPDTLLEPDPGSVFKLPF